MRPQLPERAFDTYGIVLPKTTHTRAARCEEVNCQAYAHGWKTPLDTSIPQQRELARLVVKNDGKRRWTAEQNGHLVTFTFPAGQQCFADHRVPLDRPPVFTLKSGLGFAPKWGDHVTLHDGAIYVRGARAIRGEEWVERLGENQQAIIDAQNKG
jgi:hypothetical protein